MSIAVTRGNRTLILKGYGKSNLELDTSTTPNTVYHIDSITKNFADVCDFEPIAIESRSVAVHRAVSVSGNSCS
jgi:hypothetical protein